jgi:NADPH-dependent 2,4-dienoyl-CoA reductase/sulfur reductase-like enzyme
MLNRPFDPETRIVSRAEQPPMRERGCDICVVGSGASGISAAIEAARAGLKVILVDGLPTLGGQAVNSIIGCTHRGRMARSSRTASRMKSCMTWVPGTTSR